jgi:hypothetical protein
VKIPRVASESSPRRVSSLSRGDALHFPGGLFSIPQKKYDHSPKETLFTFPQKEFFLPQGESFSTYKKVFLIPQG